MHAASANFTVFTAKIRRRRLTEHGVERTATAVIGSGPPRMLQHPPYCAPLLGFVSAMQLRAAAAAASLLRVRPAALRAGAFSARGEIWAALREVREHPPPPPFERFFRVPARRRPLPVLRRL